MESKQAEEMIRIMENENYVLDSNVKLKKPRKKLKIEVEKPLQMLFDECLNFISVTDFEE